MSVPRSRSILLVLLSALAVSALALVLSGCGVKEPAYDVALGEETDQAIYVTNTTGRSITGLAVAEEGAGFEGNLLEEDATLADAQVAKIFVGTPVADEAAEEPADEAAEDGVDDAVAGEAVAEKVESAPQYNMQISFDDGTTAIVYGIVPSDVNEFAICFEDEVAFTTYTDGEGNEVSTKEQALEKKAELDRIAAEEAAAEAAAQAAQQQYYYVNSYGADTSAGQGQTGCLF